MSKVLKEFKEIIERKHQCEIEGNSIIVYASGKSYKFTQDRPTWTKLSYACDDAFSAQEIIEYISKIEKVEREYSVYNVKDLPSLLGKTINYTYSTCDNGNVKGTIIIKSYSLDEGDVNLKIEPVDGFPCEVFNYFEDGTIRAGDEMDEVYIKVM